jgi:hypothetical protein
VRQTGDVPMVRNAPPTLGLTWVDLRCGFVGLLLEQSIDSPLIMIEPVTTIDGPMTQWVARQMSVRTIRRHSLSATWMPGADAGG